MAVKTFTTGEVLTAADTNTYLNNGGLVYIKSQTIGTAVASVAVTSAFSADFDNYVITVSGGAGSTNMSLKLQLGATVTNYALTLSYSNYTSTPLAVGSTTDTAFTYAGSGTSTSLGMYCTLQNPYLAEHTFVQGATANGSFAGTMSGYLPTTTSYTDFTIITSTGTMTGGTIRVYGMRQA